MFRFKYFILHTQAQQKQYVTLQQKAVGETYLRFKLSVNSFTHTQLITLHIVCIYPSFCFPNQYRQTVAGTFYEYAFVQEPKIHPVISRKVMGDKTHRHRSLYPFFAFLFQGTMKEAIYILAHVKCCKPARQCLDPTVGKTYFFLQLIHSCAKYKNNNI